MVMEAIDGFLVGEGLPAGGLAAVVLVARASLSVAIWKRSRERGERRGRGIYNVTE